MGRTLSFLSKGYCSLSAIEKFVRQNVIVTESLGKRQLSHAEGEQGNTRPDCSQSLLYPRKTDQEFNQSSEQLAEEKKIYFLLSLGCHQLWNYRSWSQHTTYF